MKAQEDFAAKGMVSIWVGDFASEEAFDGYMRDGEFEQDFGFKIAAVSERMGTIERSPVPIAELVEGLSSWPSFGLAAVQACAGLGIRQATAMMVFYGMKFDPGAVSVNANAPFRFVGAFPFK
jgi:hypothetical protein